MPFANDLPATVAAFMSQFMSQPKLRALYGFLTELKTRLEAAEGAASSAGTAAAAAQATANGRVAPGRQVATGTGLSGGGDLSADRTLAIAAHTALVSKSFNPASRVYTKNSVTTVYEIDAGSNGVLLPVGYQLPVALSSGNLRPQIAFVYSDGTLTARNNASTGATMGDNLQGILNTLMNDAQSGQAVQNDGKYLQRIRFEVQNLDVNNDITGDLGAFRVNALAFPRGAGALTIT